MSPSTHCLLACLSLGLSLVLAQEDQEAVLLKALQSQDTKVLRASQDRVMKMQSGPRTRILRKGMLLDNRPAAAWCATQLSWTELSNAEAPRYLELLWPLLTQDSAEADLEQFRSMLGSSELGPYLEDLPPSGDRELPGALILEKLHRQLRPEHIPLLCKLMLGDDLEVANKALEQISMMAQQGDSHRALIARTLLTRKTSRDRRRAANAHGLGPLVPPTLPDKTEGYPPLLHACLTHFFDKAQVSIRQRPWKARIENWLLRWTHEVHAASSDRSLLARLLSSKQLLGEVIALRGLGQVRDNRDREALLAFAQSSRGTGRLLARASLARMGDEKSLEWIRRQAPKEVLAMGFLLELAPKLARPLILETLRGDFLGKVQEILELPRSARALQLCIRLSYAKDYAWLESQLRRGRIPILNRIALLVHVPPFRSQRLLFALADPSLFTELQASQSDSFYQGDLAEFLGLLETSSRRQALRFLQGLAQHEVKSIRAFALDMLLKLGAPEMEDLLIDHVRWAPAADAGRQRILLGRTKTDKVKRWLAEQSQVKDEQRLPAMRGLGIAQGLPEALVWLDEEDVLDEKDLQHVLRELREGRAREALLFWLKKSTALFPERIPAEHPGLLADPSISRYLLELRDRRELGHYAWATGQLAMQGHPSAMLEQAAVLRIGRFAWVDEADPWSLLLDRDLDRIPLAISELESSCCRLTSVATMFAQLFGQDFREDSQGGGSILTAHQAAKDWWKAAKGNLRYSHILDRYLIAVTRRRKE